VKLTDPAGGASKAATSDATSGLLNSLRTADVELGAGPNVEVGIVSRVPDLLEHPRTLGALVGYVEAISPAFEGKAVSDTVLDRSSETLARSFARDADIAITGVVGTDVTGKFELLVGDVITFGLDAEADDESELLVGALYRNATGGLAVSRTCYPGPQNGS